MSKTHAVGIDLGTTYSCIASLNEHGEPITIPNAEGEMSTPSAVMFDGNEIVVGTEALRHAIMQPGKVIQNAKRYIGETDKFWHVDGKKISPVEVEAMILKKLIGDAQMQIGSIEEAVVTVPAQFSDSQRHATIEAGHRAGLQRVDIINEPVAASLCYVLGTEGIWFSELAESQRILVYDLGGGTFDLSLVTYKKDSVAVLASSGDLHLGGIDWNNALMNAIADQFSREFSSDPRTDPSSLQALSLETEQAKRSLSVREKTALTVQHGGHRKSYQIEQGQFEVITRPLVDKTIAITKALLKENNFGWAHVDAVLTTGGSSRMPMVRESLKLLSGTTLNTTLSPDQSIAHGATYYAGMLLSNNAFAHSILSTEARSRLKNVKQSSVTARSLGILVRDMESDKRVPHYLIKENTPLPVEAVHIFGTVVPNQQRVNLQVVESGTSKTSPHSRIGQCVIDDLPRNLPEGSKIAVTIRYDEEAKVHVSAKEVVSGKVATTEILRKQSAVNQLETHKVKEEEAIELELAPEDEVIDLDLVEDEPPAPPPVPRPSKPKVAPTPQPVPAVPASQQKIDRADRPIPLCNRCGEALNSKGVCTSCGAVAASRQQKPAGRRPTTNQKTKQQKRPAVRPNPAAQRPSKPKPVSPSSGGPKVKPLLDDDILELDAASGQKPQTNRPPRKRPVGEGGGPKPVPLPKRKPQSPPTQKPSGQKNPESVGEDEFWKMLEDE